VLVEQFTVFVQQSTVNDKSFNNTANFFLPWIRAFIFKLPKQSNLLVGVRASVITLLGVLPLNTARPATSEGRLEAEVNVLLGIQAHNEAGHIDHLKDDPN